MILFLLADIFWAVCLQLTDFLFIAAAVVVVLNIVSILVFRVRVF
jgi:hypothetical protein